MKLQQLCDSLTNVNVVDIEEKALHLYQLTDTELVADKDIVDLIGIATSPVHLVEGAKVDIVKMHEKIKKSKNFISNEGFYFV